MSARNACCAFVGLLSALELVMVSPRARLIVLVFRYVERRGSRAGSLITRATLSESIERYVLDRGPEIESLLPDASALNE